MTKKGRTHFVTYHSDPNAACTMVRDQTGCIKLQGHGRDSKEKFYTVEAALTAGSFSAAPEKTTGNFWETTWTSR